MHRRRLLTAVTGLSGLATLSGCSLFGSGEEAVSTETTEGRAPTVEPYTEPQVDRPTDGDETPGATAPRDCRPRGVHVVNTAAADQYVTVALDAVDSGASAVESASVPAGETVVHEALAAGRGRYRVTVDTADGRVSSGEFVVSEGTSDLVVFAGTDRVRLRQRATGWPDCPLVSTGSETRPPPSPPVAEALRRYGLQRVVVDNVGTEPTTARLGVVAVDGSRTLLDHGYRLPPGMRLDLPLLPLAASYDLTVATDEGRERRRWDVEREPVVRVALDGGAVAFPASPSVREPATPQSALDAELNHLVNGDNRPHAVTLTLRRGDRLLVAEGYNLAIDEQIGLGVSLPEAADGQSVELAVSTADGAAASVTWDGCPPRGTVVVALDDRGEFRIYSSRTGSLTD
ncbi:hypothetical protein SAMN04487949_1971 [Halogranum gelatinilyticum]|uniref:Ig-like domain-containing protein n=1 Tax=Halogranum gelatinilyticum TaxID=660521 RepID=A0A1G9TYZ0_9EURY|nr:hypothetical protein [Halogranum gelatinilyticum]SDM52886.1 hypothetical protein SAMN04487949_1971 [Halogranum gelatinilyticum]